MSFVARLRRETAADHQRVDAAFERFDLAVAADYRRFLIAHARALPVVEAVLATDAALPAWRPRAALLAADLADSELAMPSPLSFAADAAGRWGALYVIDGSRLGGALLSRRVGQGLPARYLAATHEPGEWRALLQALDISAGDATWEAGVLAGARAAFALYERAAASI